MGAVLRKESLKFIESVYQFREIPFNGSNLTVEIDAHLPNSENNSYQDFTFCDNSIQSDSSSRQESASDYEVTTTKLH
jgi:hypothetical protein